MTTKGQRPVRGGGAGRPGDAFVVVASVTT
jgi:hypothetical protein